LLSVEGYAPAVLTRSLTHPTGFIDPCLPTLAHVVPDGSRWAFEVKHDGFRFIARREGERVRVFSRNAKDWTDRVPLIVEAMLALPVTSATIDGEGDRFRAPTRRPGRIWRVAGRGPRSCTASTSSRSTARTCAGTHGKSAVRP